LVLFFRLLPNLQYLYDASSICDFSHPIWYNDKFTKIMTFTNMIDVWHFLTVHPDIASLCGENSALINCINDFNRMCACDNREGKKAKGNQCYELYVRVAMASRSNPQLWLSKVVGSEITFLNSSRQPIVILKR
jgi:hypothetical protein